MKNKKIISALDYIEDSFITEAEEYKGNKKMKKEIFEIRNGTGFMHRYFKPVIAAVAAFALIFGGCLMAPQSEAQKFGLLVVSAAEPEQVLYEVYDESAVQLPVKAMLKVADIRNINTEKASAYQEKMIEDMEKYLNFDDKTLNNYGYRCHTTENAIIYYGYMNSFVLKGIDVDRLSELEISLDGLGVLEINNMSYSNELNEYGKKFVITAEEYKTVYTGRTESGTFAIGWMFGDEIVDRFDNNPTENLSVINDVVTFTARYTDGTSDSFEIGICFDENGTMSAVYKK